jgi:hypothetical protein
MDFQVVIISVVILILLLFIVIQLCKWYCPSCSKDCIDCWTKHIDGVEEYIKITSNSIHPTEKDPFIKLWNKQLFIDVNNIKINYLVTYHGVTGFPYIKDSINIILDGEPMNIANVVADITIFGKKKMIPNIPGIYVPVFVYSFLENKKDPQLLIKKPDEQTVKTKFCCFTSSNCDNKFNGVVNRKKFLELMNKMTGNRVDNLGRCYNNNYKDSGKWTSNHETYKPYKFVIAFENQEIEGYITEKLVCPMIARAIPIYLGGSDVTTYFNAKSFINVNDFTSFERCIEYIIRVDNNDVLYKSIMNEPYFKDNIIDKNLFSVYYGGQFYHQLHEILQNTRLAEFIRPCMFYSNNIKFITFSDGNKYRHDRILKEAQNSGFFKECKAYGPKDLYRLFWEKHKKFMINNPRGFGYYIWKSQIILQSMNELRDGDYLIWSDSGNTINPLGYRRIKELYSILESNDIIVYRIKYQETDWSKMDAIVAVSQEFRNYQSIDKDSKQKTSSILMLKKSKVSMEMVKLWARLSENYHLSDDSQSLLPNFKGFKENRHDQTILSLITRQTTNTISVDDNIEDTTTKFVSDNGEQLPIVPTRIK